jgi:hypothetical protein
VLNVLARLKQPVAAQTIIDSPLILQEAPQANVARYEQLRSQPEVNDVA